MLLSFFVVPMSAFMLLSFAMNDFDMLSSGKTNRILLYASNISYAFFLAQFFTWPTVKAVATKLGFDNNVFKAVTAFVLCVAIAVVFHEIVEKRGTAWIRKIADKSGKGAK